MTARNPDANSHASFSRVPKRFPARLTPPDGLTLIIGEVRLMEGHGPDRFLSLETEARPVESREGSIPAEPSLAQGP